MEVTFDEFRQDLLNPDGSVWIEDVLFIRGTAPIPGGEMVYMVPMIHAAEENEVDKELMRELIAIIIDRQVKELCLN